MSFTLKQNLSLLSLASLSLIFVGCQQEPDVRVYKAPLDEAPKPPASQAAANANNGPQLSWQVPSAWTAQGPSGMRRETFAINNDAEKAELTVIAFPGDAGGLLANVNRWRGQLQLAPTKPNELSTSAIPIQSRAGQVDAVELISEDKSKGMLGAALFFGGETWFFKLMGSAELIESEKERFFQFLRTIRTSSSTTAVAPPPAQPQAPRVSSTASAGRPQVKETSVPKNWTASKGSSMRLTSYAITGEDGATADLSVIALQGMAGGDLPNVNRWRGQLQLPPYNETAYQESSEAVTSNEGLTFTVVYFASDKPDQDGKHKAILAALAQKNDFTWFIKMTGERDLVASQKTDFKNYLQNLEVK